MKKIAFLTLLSTALFASDVKVGIINFNNCITDSKYGKQEQGNLENLSKQMATLIEDTEKQLKGFADKANDKDYRDGLSPEGEYELNTKLHTLEEELQRYRFQYSQVLNQAHFKMMQTMQGHINQAAETIAAQKKLEIVGNKEAFFYNLPSLDVTAEVIKELDKAFDLDIKKQSATVAAEK